jgi:hypothetical protein
VYVSNRGVRQWLPADELGCVRQPERRTATRGQLAVIEPSPKVCCRSLDAIWENVFLTGSILRNALRYCFFSGSTFGSLFPGGNSPSNALINAFRNALKIVVSISGFG